MNGQTLQFRFHSKMENNGFVTIYEIIQNKSILYK